jgi:hypothetical protein
MQIVLTSDSLSIPAGDPAPILLAGEQRLDNFP